MLMTNDAPRTGSISGSPFWGPDMGIMLRGVVDSGCYRVTYYEVTYGKVVNDHLTADQTRKLIEDIDARGCMYRIHIARKV